MRARTLLVPLLAVSLVLVGCIGPTGTQAVPVPDVHVILTVAPDPARAGHCCKVTLVNPTRKTVYVLCSVTVYRPGGTLAFRGRMAGSPGGWLARPGTTTGATSIVATDGRQLRWHQHWSLSTRCDAFVYKGEPPV